MPPPLTAATSPMLPTQQGSIRLFRFAGIEVSLHWSWFVIALIEINHRSREYSSFLWNGLEYLTLFGIVLLHEFGHARACRQVGERSGSSCGRWEGWRMCHHRHGPAPRSGALPRDRW